MGKAVQRTSAGRRRRRALGFAALVSVASTASCGGQSGSAAACSNAKVVEERESMVAYRGPVAEPSELLVGPAPRLMVQLANSQGSIERVRLSFNGSEALDIDLPADRDCNPGPPVFSVAYNPPPGPMEVQLDLQGATSTSTIDVPESATVWAVVNVQSEREWGDIAVYESQPFWG